MDLYVDRSLPPYDLPIKTWGSSWWNRPDFSYKAWSKITTAEVAIKNNINHPLSVAFNALEKMEGGSQYVPIYERVEEILELLGGKVVIKPDRGMMGEGVELVDSLEKCIEIMRETKIGVVQEYVKEGNETLRLLCSKNKVIACFNRVSSPGSFKGNVAQGAKIHPVVLQDNDEIKNISLRAMRALNLDMAGIDIIDTPEGPMFLEANPSFGVEGLLELYPNAVNELVENLLKSSNTCSCGDTGPHDAWGCY